MLVYKNMILPIIEYRYIFMVGTSIENRKKLQILQNKGLRCALQKDRDMSIDELHIEGKLERLKAKREQHLLCHMFDMAQVEAH